MGYIALEKISKDEQAGLYKTVLAVAKRANEIAQGAQPLIKTNSKKATMIALEEFQAGVVGYEEVKTESKTSAS